MNVLALIWKFWEGWGGWWRVPGIGGFVFGPPCRPSSRGFGAVPFWAGRVGVGLVAVAGWVPGGTVTLGGWAVVGTVTGAC